jgi:hypothetical protein
MVRHSVFSPLRLIAALSASNGDRMQFGAQKAGVSIPILAAAATTEQPQAMARMVSQQRQRVGVGSFMAIQSDFPASLE